MFKIGDKIRRKEKQKCTWWYNTCLNNNVDPEGIYTVTRLGDTVSVNHLTANWTIENFELAEQDLSEIGLIKSIGYAKFYREG